MTVTLPLAVALAGAYVAAAVLLAWWAGRGVAE